MSLVDILGSARSGLTAAQAALKTVSTNIANVGTPGYAREAVNLTTSVIQGRVVGVAVGEPSRIADTFLEDIVYNRAGDAGRADAEATYLDRLQSLLGEPGAQGGIPARMDAITAAATAMTGLSNSPQTVGNFVRQVEDAIASLQQLAQDTHQVQADAEAEIGYNVDRVNSLLTRIHQLNGEVARLDGLGRSTSGAADQRMQAVEELSGLLSITVRHQPDGRITIDSADGKVLIDRQLRQLSYAISGGGAAQGKYPPINLHFADEAGNIGAATGEQLSGAASGGTIGGLITLRDTVVPGFTDKLGLLFGGLAEAVNSASNASTAMPPPNSLAGRATGLTGADRLGFTGQAQFAVTDAQGTLVATTTVDFSALGAGATVTTAVAAINAGLGATATASLDPLTGALTLTAANAANGVSIGQGTPPSDRAGVGFSQFFGLNDVIQSAESALVPSGFAPTDAHGFTTGQTVELMLRDAQGRELASASLAPQTGGTFATLLTNLNASPLAAYGSFSMDARGRFVFTPQPGAAGARISIPSDSTDRSGTGRTFTALSGLTGSWAGLESGAVRKELVGNPTRLPLATLQSGIAVGAKALGSGDVSGALAQVNALSASRDFAAHGTASLERYTSDLMGGIGSAASIAKDRLTDATARRTDAVNRRDSFSGVNLDEELTQMVVLQNSYSASARVITAASQMYDTLLEMTR
ncbi:MAG: flagellar basal body protein [Sphingobium sp.]|jgi:flagellar hook-associated protein 1 FlgK|nr:flagellar basal body protein [Sphingobium sp.]MCI1271347.1 flagellar basal body protein [Sphingobium sp.]MCI1756860.1 flagellar basal body protein [Sphingobium sp.]MCI2053980.1 flagellar basal body protein [Sphingobium sp.]